jgi:lactoylglutathione lyase
MVRETPVLLSLQALDPDFVNHYEVLHHMIAWKLNISTRKHEVSLARETQTTFRAANTRIHHPVTMPASMRIELFPSDMSVFIDFYTKILNFTLLQRKGTYAYINRDSVYIGAIVTPTADSLADRASYRQPFRGVELVFEVDDLVAERNRIVGLGYKLEKDIEKQEWNLEDFRLVDPDGYYIRITTRN